MNINKEDEDFSIHSFEEWNSDDYNDSEIDSEIEIESTTARKKKSYCYLTKFSEENPYWIYVKNKTHVYIYSRSEKDIHSLSDRKVLTCNAPLVDTITVTYGCKSISDSISDTTNKKKCDCGLECDLFTTDVR